jgi:hypothetical protein
MGNCDKLLLKARASAKNFRFDDLCKLAECYGWVATRREGSHCMYENDKLDMAQGRMQNFQSVRGEAKPYQVKQLLNAIEVLDTNAE